MNKNDKKTSRKNFLKMIGLTAGTTLLTSDALAGLVNRDEILRLNPEQQEFMIRYEQWMDEFIEVIRVQKTDPENHRNNARMITLTEKAEKLKPELDLHLQDENFTKIYLVCIKRMTEEI